jgi:hypothetical protein
MKHAQGWTRRMRDAPRHFLCASAEAIGFHPHPCGCAPVAHTSRKPFVRQDRPGSRGTIRPSDGLAHDGCPSSLCNIAKRASFCCADKCIAVPISASHLVEFPHTPARRTLFPLSSSRRRMSRAYSADTFCSSKPCWIALDASSVGRPSTARCSKPSPH